MVTAERALAQADAADRLAAGIVLGPLHGVPVAVKDSVQWEGTEATLLQARGRPDQRRHRPGAALAAHGMVILGKTRMTEFAFGLSGQNGTQGTARNPWDARSAPGGRGAARWRVQLGAAVAAGAGAGRRYRRLRSRAPAALNGLSASKAVDRPDQPRRQPRRRR